MADNKVVAQQRKERGVARDGDAERGADVPKGVSANVLNQLMVFIPTEVITIWVAFIAIYNYPKAPAGKKLHEADFSDLWMLTVGFAALAAILTLGLTWRKAKDTNVKFALPIFEMLAAAVAFTAWAIALPKTPLASASWYDQDAGAFILLVATIAITTVGYILGKTVKFEKS